MEIHRITTEFEDEARNLILEGLSERFGFIDNAYNPDLNHIIETYDSNGNLFLVGFLGNELVCTGALTREKENTGRIERMSVKKKYRRQGLARKMIAELELRAKELGYKQTVLETNNDWISAIELYKNNGYRESHNDEGCIHLFKNLG